MCRGYNPLSLLLFKLLALYKENHPLSRFYFSLALLLGDNLIVPLLYSIIWEIAIVV